MASGSDLKFVSDFLICPEESDLRGLIDQMDQCSSDSVYKGLIDLILNRFMEEHNGPNGLYVRNVLIEFYARTHTRKNPRKYMYEELNSRKMGAKTLFEYVVDSVTNEIQENINNLNIFRLNQCFKMLCFLSTFIQNFNNVTARFIYLLEKVFPFYLCILEVYTSQLFNSSFSKDGCEGKSILDYPDCYKVLCHTLQQLATALPRAKHECVRSYAVKMVIMIHEILQCHSQLKFDTISKGSIVLAYFSVFMPPEETEFLKYKNYPMLDFMDNPTNDYCMVLKSKTLTNLFLTNRMKVVLNLAVYTLIEQQELLNLQISGKPLLEFVYSNLIRLGIQMTSFPEQISPISRTLDAMARYLHRLPNYDEIFEKAIDFAWGHLDHFIESVVVSSRSFLQTVIKEAAERYQRGEKHHLDNFIRDLNSMSVFSKVRLNALAAISRVVHCDFILANCPQVQNQLLTLATSSAEHDMAGQTYINLMTTHLLHRPEEDTIRIWLRPVLTILRQPNIKYHGVLEEIVTNAFKSRPTIFRRLFNPRTAGTGTECVIILNCVHYARMNGITLPMEADDNRDDFWRNLIVKTKLELFMIHQEEEVRINALRAIAECQKTTEEFTAWELVYLIRYFQYNVAAQTPSIRNKIANYYKKILTRYHVTYPNITKRISGLESVMDRKEETDQDRREHEEAETELEEARTVLQEYKDFFMHFVQLLVLYLSPDANYSRRSICLELLIFVHPFSDENHWQNTWQQDEIKNLKHLVYDSYEGNKAMAVSLLRTLPAASIGFDSEESTRQFFNKCLRMACDIRPSQSVSASYMFQVILQSEFQFSVHEESAIEITNKNQCLMLIAMGTKLQSMFEASNENVIEAAKTTPFYGLLLSIRNLLRNRDIRDDNEVYAYIFQELADLCLNMQSHIMPVVCNTSPEGHVPESSDESDDSFLESDQSTKAQKILVYSWKTMKEIMLLLAELANQTVTLENVLEMLPEAYLFKIGYFFMDIFIRTKHRGVFEQAHVAFTTICRSFIHSKNENLNNMPVKWLNEAVSLCTGKKIDDRLCATRRSAGLPFLILSIIPTLTDTNHDYLRRTIDPLLHTSTGENDELRTHCLNVLRFMFKNSKLSENIAHFIDRGAISALQGFKSKAWGVRNSSTLLLSALITRMFGVPNRSQSDADHVEDKRMTLAVFYMRYRKLLEFLLQTLEEECEKSDSLILHPALLILSRLYPSHNDNINEKVKRHIPCINVCIRNPSYRTRDLAARASVSLISEHCLMRQLDKDFDRICGRAITDNECHGLLLQIRHIFYTTIFDELPISEYLTKSMHLLSEPGRRYSHLTVTLYMDIVFMLLSKYRDYKNLDLLKHMVVALARQTKEEELTTCRTSYSWSRFQLLIFILFNKFQHVGSTFHIVTRIIVKSLYGKDMEMKKKCLYLLIYLNQVFCNDQYREHPLITAGDVEICPQIRALVHSLDFKSKKELLTYTHPYLISFFYAELKAQLKKDDNYFVLVFLLLRFYPCFFHSLRTDRKQNILDWFLTMTKVYNEEIISAVVSCLKTFIMTLGHEEMKHLRYSDLIKLLMESAAPSAADYRRLTVAQFLVGTQMLFKCKIFSEYDRYNVLNVIMVLLEDDEALVRNTMSIFPTKRNRVATTPALWHVIPNKARSTLLVSSASEFNNDVAICCLASWALRRLPEVTRDTSEVYERGELNIYSENIPVTHCAGKVLHTLLWNLGDVLTYEDHTIFLEEQTLLITTVVLNSLINVPSPMMDRETKRTVICVFKCISKFIEECTIGNDFKNKFRAFFNSKILKFLRNSLDTDYASAKAFLTYLYNPLLNAHFRFPSQ